MNWQAAEPGAYDLSRHEIDLCYREVFGGFRPTITIERGDGPLIVRAQANIQPRTDSKPIWRATALPNLNDR